MIVKAISNKYHRDISVGKLYPIISKSSDKEQNIRIIDDTGLLTIYKFIDFEIYKTNISSYSLMNDILIYQSVAYSSFLSDYYDDNHNAVEKLIDCQIEILGTELTAIELFDCITSEVYSEEEKNNLIMAITGKTTKDLAEKLAIHFADAVNIGSELKFSLCKCLEQYKSIPIYDLFVSYLAEFWIDTSPAKDIIIKYLDTYYD
ncbi:MULTISPECIES: hypothetical protein [Listeria]|uniref:hypothetical protein n=1 Tax=Listeria TaxID=1637 RepID=UPI000B590D7F|nr:MULTISPECIES: hypothetical protein [Listeria]